MTSLDSFRFKAFQSLRVSHSEFNYQNATSLQFRHLYHGRRPQGTAASVFLKPLEHFLSMTKPVSTRFTRATYELHVLRSALQKSCNVSQMHPNLFSTLTSSSTLSRLSQVLIAGECLHNHLEKLQCNTVR